jgi:HEAT repeat protein
MRKVRLFTIVLVLGVLVAFILSQEWQASRKAADTVVEDVRALEAERAEPRTSASARNAQVAEERLEDDAGAGERSVAGGESDSALEDAKEMVEGNGERTEILMGIYLIAQMHSTEAREYLLDRIARAADVEVREQFVKCVVLNEGSELTGRLTEMLRSDPSRTVRQLAADAMARREPANEEITKALRHCLSAERDDSVRRAIVSSLGHREDEGAYVTLIAIVRSEFAYDLRTPAALALRHQGNGPHKAKVVRELETVETEGQDEQLALAIKATLGVLRGESGIMD